MEYGVLFVGVSPQTPNFASNSLVPDAQHGCITAWEGGWEDGRKGVIAGYRSAALKMGMQKKSFIGMM
jgi:hypothetical protein